MQLGPSLPFMFMNITMGKHGFRLDLMTTPAASIPCPVYLYQLRYQCVTLFRTCQGELVIMFLWIGWNSVRDFPTLRSLAVQSRTGPSVRFFRALPPFGWAFGSYLATGSYWSIYHPHKHRCCFSFYMTASLSPQYSALSVFRH